MTSLEGPSSSSSAPAAHSGAARVYTFQENAPDAVINIQVVDLGRQLYVWLAAGGARLGDLCCGIITPHVSIPGWAGTTLSQPAWGPRSSNRTGQEGAGGSDSLMLGPTPPTSSLGQLQGPTSAHCSSIRQGYSSPRAQRHCYLNLGGGPLRCHQAPAPHHVRCATCAAHRPPNPLTTARRLYTWHLQYKRPLSPAAAAVCLLLIAPLPCAAPGPAPCCGHPAAQPHRR